MENYRDGQKEFHWVFIDLEKAHHNRDEDGAGRVCGHRDSKWIEYEWVEQTRLAVTI